MTVGEFSRKLKEAVKAEGYTSNNVKINTINRKTDCFELLLVDSKDNFFCSLYRRRLIW